MSQYCVNHRTLEAVAWSFSVKKGVLKSFSKSTPKLCARSSFLLRLQVEEGSFIERELQHSDFPEKFAKLLYKLLD